MLVQQAIKQRDQMIMHKAHQVFEGNSLINQSLRTASFTNYNTKNPDQQNAKETMMKYVTTFNTKTSPNILLVGSYGVGKSHLAVATTKELMKDGNTCLFLSVPKLLTKIKQTYNKNSIVKEVQVVK